MCKVGDNPSVNYYFSETMRQNLQKGAKASLIIGAAIGALIGIVLVGIHLNAFGMHHILQTSRLAQGIFFGASALTGALLITALALKILQHKQTKKEQIEEINDEIPTPEIKEIPKEEPKSYQSQGKQLKKLLKSTSNKPYEVLTEEEIKQFEEIFSQIPPNTACFKGRTPLMLIAIYEAHQKFIPLVDILVEQAKKQGEKLDFNSVDTLYFGNTILLGALANGNNDIAYKLLEVGAHGLDVNQVGRDERTRGNTPLILAVAKGYTEFTYGLPSLKVGKSAHELVEKMLAMGAHVDTLNTLGYTAIDYAIMRGDIEMVKLLLPHSSISNERVEELLKKEKEEVLKIFQDTTSVMGASPMGDIFKFIDYNGRDNETMRRLIQEKNK